MLLESDNLTMQHGFERTRSREEAQRNAEEIIGTCPSVSLVFSNAAAINATASETKKQCFIIVGENVAAVREKCCFCGNNKHAVCYKSKERAILRKFSIQTSFNQ